MNLGNLTLEDFVKAGWSAEDVKEIMNLSNKEETHTDEHEPTQPDNEQTHKDTDEHEQTQPDNELQKQLKEMQEQLTQTQKDLAAAQAVNRNQNFGDNNLKSDEEIFSDFVKSY